MVVAKVRESVRSDVGRGIIRLGKKLMKSLKLEVGDAIIITGKKDACALVWSELPDDENIIKMDGILRHNAGTSLDEEVELKKVELKEAKKMLLAPTQEISFSADFVDYVKEKILNMPLLVENSLLINVLGTQLQLIVTKMEPSPGRITWDTDLKIADKPMKVAEKTKGIRYENIGGLEKEIEAIREMVEIPMKNPEVFRKLGISPPKGVLLHGPPGTGKTLLAKAVANETDAHFIALNGPEIMSKYYGQSEENLRNVFKEAKENAPSIIFIDEIDAIASSREEAHGEVEKRVVSQLLTMMDGLEARGNVMVIAATNRPDSLDPALRRPGRFDRELQIGMPTRIARKEILQIHTRNMPITIKKEEINSDLISKLKELTRDGKREMDLSKVIKVLESDDNVNKKIEDLYKQVDKNLLTDLLRQSLVAYLADESIGFSGADLEVLAKEAAMRALRRVMPQIKQAEGNISKKILDGIIITIDDFFEALKFVEPSAMRDIAVEIPKVSWDDVGGLEDVKAKIKESIEWPMKYPEHFKVAGITPPQGIMLYGPPGTGKTLIAKAIANEAKLNFIVVKGPELLSKWVGESEKGIRKIFGRARHVAPAMIFFDEIDALVPTRGRSNNDVSDKLTAQLLTEMDGITKIHDIIIMGSTNRLDLLDPALLRPGRFDIALYVGLPDKNARKQILKVHSKDMTLSSTVKFEEIAEKTENYSGADLRGVCVEAGLEGIRRAIKEKRDLKEVTMKDFLEAIKKIKPSVDSAIVEGKDVNVR
ncbi:MAG: AAA family ATPase [Candidatus Diapherotrites archaeon CG09_land_8_20_14_0_10_32_12]|nr:MAG: AAA family ATPase [Candidatus Diapherotrites archaeon CG09_land_8_20_14_0_10_32_12]